MWRFEPRNENLGQFSIRSIFQYPESHALAQDNSTPTKQPYCTEHSHLPRPAVSRNASSGTSHQNMGPGLVSPNTNSAFSADNASPGVSLIRHLWLPMSRRRKQHETTSAQDATGNSRPRTPELDFYRFFPNRMKHLASDCSAVIARLSTRCVGGGVHGYGPGAGAQASRKPPSVVCPDLARGCDLLLAN